MSVKLLAELQKLMKENPEIEGARIITMSWVSGKFVIMLDDLPFVPDGYEYQGDEYTYKSKKYAMVNGIYFYSLHK